MKDTELNVLFFGSAGAAKAVYYWLKAANEAEGAPRMRVLGFVEKDESEIGRDVFAGMKVIACDDNVDEIIRKYGRVGAIVPFGEPSVKRRVIEKLRAYPQLEFPNVFHPSVICDPDGGSFGIGNYVGPGVIFESEYSVGNFNYIGNAVQFGHDIRIGDYNSFLPAAAVAGNVTFGDSCMLGMNASVIQELTIADGVTIGAGAVAVRSMEEAGTYVGIPAARIR